MRKEVGTYNDRLTALEDGLAELAEIVFGALMTPVDDPEEEEEERG